MNEAWIQFRLYISEKLLTWAFDIAPITHKDGFSIKKKVSEYFLKLNIDINGKGKH